MEKKEILDCYGCTILQDREHKCPIGCPCIRLRAARDRNSDSAFNESIEFNWTTGEDRFVPGGRLLK